MAQTFLFEGMKYRRGREDGQWRGALNGLTESGAL